MRCGAHDRPQVRASRCATGWATRTDHRPATRWARSCGTRSLRRRGVNDPAAGGCGAMNRTQHGGRSRPDMSSRRCQGKARRRHTAPPPGRRVCTRDACRRRPADQGEERHRRARACRRRPALEGRPQACLLVCLLPSARSSCGADQGREVEIRHRQRFAGDASRATGQGVGEHR